MCGSGLAVHGKIARNYFGRRKPRERTDRMNIVEGGVPSPRCPGLNGTVIKYVSLKVVREILLQLIFKSCIT